MNQPEVEHVVETGEPRTFRPLEELIAEDKRIGRRQRRKVRAAARARRRKGRLGC